MADRVRSILRGIVAFLLSSGKVRLQVIHWLLERYPAEVLSTFSAHRVSAGEALRRELDEEGKSHLLAPLLEIFAEASRDRILPRRYLDLICHATGASLHYGQEAEDVLLEQIGLPEKGFFVDVWAHHPVRFSNTYALYRKGWRGINIDATPGSMDLFRKMRPGDINIEAAVSDDPTPRTLYLFEEAALNTFDRELADSRLAAGWPLKEKRDISRTPLVSLLDRYVPAGVAIDLLSVDVEGEEMGVLRSNDWDRYRPAVIVLEDLAASFEDLGRSEVVAYLADRSYEPVSKLVRSLIFRRKF